MAEPDFLTRSRIDDLLAKYALSLDADEIEECIGLFEPDGKFQVFGRSFDGADGLRRMFTIAPRGLHLAGRALIDVDGDTGTVRQQLVFIDATTHELRLAIYDDVVVNHDERWLFRSRRCQFLTADGLRDKPE